MMPTPALSKLASQLVVHIGSQKIGYKPNERWTNRVYILVFLCGLNLI
jgi:hypothetical protein